MNENETTYLQCFESSKGTQKDSDLLVRKAVMWDYQSLSHGQ